MGSYYSKVSPEIYPQHPVFRTILFGKFNEFVEVYEREYKKESEKINETSDEKTAHQKILSEQGENPIQYICELGVTQHRYDMLCYLVEQEHYPIDYKIIYPLLNRSHYLVKCYIARLLMMMSDTIPTDQVAYNTTSEMVYNLFVEYNLSQHITLVKENHYDLV
jgi:hypothetical protein